jgi:hypothetical protein
MEGLRLSISNERLKIISKNSLNNINISNSEPLKFYPGLALNLKTPY